jgi:hypothetical protein
MTTTGTDTIVAQLTGFIGGAHANAASWFCGVASDIRARLFNDHNVGEFGKNWKYLQAIDEAAARSVEQRLRALGCKGAPARFDGGRWVYVYKISSTTIE